MIIPAPSAAPPARTSRRVTLLRMKPSLSQDPPPPCAPRSSGSETLVGERSDHAFGFSARKGPPATLEQLSSVLFRHAVVCISHGVPDLVWVGRFHGFVDRELHTICQAALRDQPFNRSP